MIAHVQNLTDDRLPTWRHGRAWWWQIHAEWSCFHRTNLLKLGVGRWHLTIYLYWFGLYLGEADYEHDRGSWSVGWGDGTLQFEHPWVRQMEYRSADPWWRKQIRLTVVDWLIGRQRCTTTKGTPFRALVPLPEGCYNATATPETRVWRRRWYWPELRRDDVWLKIEGGIPYSGKGENSWDCGDDGLWGIGGETLEAAIGNAVKAVLERRMRYGHDSRGTGREPCVVLNARGEGEG